MATLKNAEGETLAISPAWANAEVGMTREDGGFVMIRQGEDYVYLCPHQVAVVSEFLAAAQKARAVPAVSA